MISSIASIGLYATGILTGPVLARALGPGGRGDVAAVLAPATVLTWVLAFGLPTAAAYFVMTIAEEDLLAAATAFGIVVGAPLATVLWFLAPSYFAGHSPDTLLWGRIFLLALPFSVGASTALEVGRRLSPDARWNCWRTAPILVPAVVTVALAAVGKLTLGLALAATLLGALFPLMLLGARLARSGRFPIPRIEVLRRMLPYAWRTASTTASTSVTTRIDQVVLVTAVPRESLGLYAVAVTVATLTSPLSSGLNLALFGHLRGEDSADRAHSRFRRSILATLAISSVAAALLAVIAPQLLRIGFGGQFEKATVALRLLLPGAVAFDVLSVLGTKLLTEGRPGEASLAAALGAVVTVVGLVVLIPHFGIEGAAAVTSSAFTIEVVFLVWRGALRTAIPAPEVGSGTGADSGV